MQRRARVSIQPTSRADLDEIRSLWNDGRVMRWVGFPEGLGYGMAKMDEWFAAIQEDPYCRHFVVRSDEVGFCGELFYRVDLRRSAALDIKFVPDAQGRGLAAEALEWLIDHVFSTEKNVDVVWTEPRAENHAAQRLYRRCGMVPEPRPAHMGDGPPLWSRRRTDPSESSGP